MITLGALFGQFKGVFGKAYVLAGVLPAVFFTFGWLYLTDGWQSALNRVADVGKNTAAATVTAGLVIVLLGVVFFASRGVLLRIIQNLPGAVLRPVREVWIRRRIAERTSAVRAKQQVLHALTALRWYKLDFVKPTYVTEGVETPDAAEAIRLAQDARAAIAEVRRDSKGVSLSDDQAMRIAQGLSALYVHAAGANPAGAREELEKWRATVDEPAATEVIERAAESLHRMYADRLAAEHAMPDVLSVKPTALGNSFATIEDYSYRRYKMDTSTMFNRIWGVLSKDERAEIADTQLTIEVLINLCWCAALLGTGTMMAYIALAVGPQRWTGDPVVLVEAITFMAFAVLFYHGALFAAEELHSKVTRVIDLNRMEMIKKLGYAVPATVADELMLFQELQGFFVQANPRDSARKLK